MRESGEALGRYLGEYLSKDWEHRLPEDKGDALRPIFWALGKGQASGRGTSGDSAER